MEWKHRVALNAAGRNEAVAGTIAREARRAETARRDTEDMILDLLEIYSYCTAAGVIERGIDKTGRLSSLIAEVVQNDLHDVLISAPLTSWTHQSESMLLESSGH